MITIEKINFDGLKPFSGKETKSFEQLCYQIAINEFGHLGKFTPIDGSGGDGGVEFHIEFNNGEKWGWQCKYFGGSGRLSESGRKAQIEKSLETACRNHPNLKKWFLCLKTDLTQNSTSSKGIVALGEQDWFDNTLPTKIPQGVSLDLEIWGESEICRKLANPNFSGLRNFFFGELEVDQHWFNQRFDQIYGRVENKYDPNLHTIDEETKWKIAFLLRDESYCEHLNVLSDRLKTTSDEIHRTLNALKGERFINQKTRDDIDGFYDSVNKLNDHQNSVSNKISEIKVYFQDLNQPYLPSSFIADLNDEFSTFIKNIDLNCFQDNSRIKNIAVLIFQKLREYNSLYTTFFQRFYFSETNTLHLVADPAKGKTHLSCNIAFEKIKKHEPAIFLTGDKFSGENNLSDAILKNLCESKSTTIDELISAIDTYGKIMFKKVPLVIDGLNETVNNRYFSEIWKNHLSDFERKLSLYKNVVLITTCRHTYKDRIWGDNEKNKHFYHLDGFVDYETTSEAVQKYFDKYGIVADFEFNSIGQFRNPILLKIFCEIKNPNFINKQKVEVNLEENSMFEIFSEYFKQVNLSITSNNHLFKKGECFIQTSLSVFADYLWRNDSRTAPVDDFYQLIDGNSPYEKDKSRADVLIHEGLLFCKDMKCTGEQVFFTYDIMAGYLIALELLSKTNDLRYFVRNKFFKKMMLAEAKHPLFDDITTALLLLLPQKKDVFWHEILQDELLFKIIKSKIFQSSPRFIKSLFANRRRFYDQFFSHSIPSIFELPSKFIGNKEADLVRRLFVATDQNKEAFFFPLLKISSIHKHPLNGRFLYDLLLNMSVSNRDLTWSEYMRTHPDYINEMIHLFETSCRSIKDNKISLENKCHSFANVVVWMLTSTVRDIRDKATRGLYEYGKIFPYEFLLLVIKSLNANDPYIVERCLASLYGIVMAKHNALDDQGFKNNLLPRISKSLYENIFSKKNKYSTTHILIRDHAKRIILLNERHNPNTLSNLELSNISSPQNVEDINYGLFEYEEYEKVHPGPIRMDFNNYTIGRLIKGGHSYSNPPEKIQVRKEIYWRIFNLGWTEEKYQDVEKQIENSSFYARDNHDLPPVERYGKKYSWIAFYEAAGRLEDQGLLDLDEDFRLSDVHIDPSFPLPLKNKELFSDDLLGDRCLDLHSWHINGETPILDSYLLKEDTSDCNWICLDGFLSQKDIDAERDTFIFLRGFLVQNNEKDKILSRLRKQSMRGRWLPEKKENHYTYFGELYSCEESTWDNDEKLTFKENIRKVKVKKGEEGYFPNFTRSFDDGSVSMTPNYPDEIEIEQYDTVEFTVLLPVMEYSWESYHSSLNQAGSLTVLSKEIVNELGLIAPPQSMVLTDQSGNPASLHSNARSDTRTESLTFIRSDLLDKFLKSKDMSLILIAWGHRELAFQSEERKETYYAEFPDKEPQVFQQVWDYEDL